MIPIQVTYMEILRMWVEVISVVARITSPQRLWRGSCRVTQEMIQLPVALHSLWNKETRRMTLGCVANWHSQQLVHLPNIASWQFMRLAIWLSHLLLVM